MAVSVSVFAATAAVMICAILFFPQIRIGKFKFSVFWVVSLLGAILVLCFSKPDFYELWRSLTADTAVNPLKILALFISMTVLSIFLDEAGFFRRLACLVLKRARTGQKKLFLLLYITVSVLTVFTSNDIIILSFTPFICYFCKNARIDPVPYLAAEFVAANTWSMALVIGNPTNIYLTSAEGMDFLTYLKYSALPTLFAGAVSAGLLFLIFRKKLATPLSGEAAEAAEDKLSMWFGIVHLAVCTVLLAVSAYAGLQMWLIALCAAASLILCSGVICLVRRQKPVNILHCFKRAPWQLIPFVLSMSVMIAVMGQKGATAAFGRFLGGGGLAFLKYGVSSFLASNVINNIPMSVLFAAAIESSGAGTGAMLATVIGSNLGACFTPIGALAGIMFGSILSEQGIKFGYRRFLKLGFAVAVPALFAALGGLWISLYCF